MLTVNALLSRKGKKIISINPYSNVYEALKLMEINDIGAVLVIEKDELIGIFSERDYARKVILNGKTEHDTIVKDVMATKVISVTPETKVKNCMVLMTEQHIRHLPVFKNNDLIGVISIGDVVKDVLFLRRIRG